MPFSNNPVSLLVVEDNPGDYVLFGEYLNQTGLTISRIDHSLCLQSAADNIKKSAYDIVFLDLSLPDSSGIESFKRLNALLPHTAIVVLSGLSDVTTAVNCISLGAQDYLVKDELNEKWLEKSIQYSIERKKNLDELVRFQIEYQRQITEAAIVGQEREKEQVGKELHDNINQILATVKIYLEVASANEAKRLEMIHRSNENLMMAISEIRKLSRSLVPPSLGSDGLKEAIEQLVDELRLAGLFTIQLHINGFDEKSLDCDRKLMFFRIIQEQLNNIIKYAKAKEVIITLSSGNEFELSIRDNGIGFDQALKPKGIGLRNIHNRVAFYSGDVDLKSAPGKGTKLTVTLPAQKNS